MALHKTIVLIHPGVVGKQVACLDICKMQLGTKHACGWPCDRGFKDFKHHLFTALVQYRFKWSNHPLTIREAHRVSFFVRV